MCTNKKVLILNDDFPVIQVLSGMGSLFSNLKSIIFVNKHEMIDLGVLDQPNFETDDSELNIVLQNQSGECTSEVLRNMQDSHRKFSLSFIGCDKNKSMVEFSTFTQSYVTKLHFQQSVLARSSCLLNCMHELPSCPFLTHISVQSSHFRIHENVLHALSKGVQEDNLPNLITKFRKSW